jgi:hypothetical protein
MQDSGIEAQSGLRSEIDIEPQRTEQLFRLLNEIADAGPLAKPKLKSWLV